MNKTSVAMLVAGVLILVGAILGGAALAMVHFDFTAFNTETVEERYFEADAAQVSAIRIRAAHNNIRIVPTGTQVVRVRYHEAEKEHYAVKAENGVLEIAYSTGRKWYDYLGVNFGMDYFDMDIEVPYGFQAEFDIEAASGNVELEDVSGTVAVKLRAGDVELKRVAASVLTAETAAGDITLEQVAGDTAAVSTATGDIEFERLGYQQATLRTKTGDIEGTVAGSAALYVIEAQTHTGEVQAPRTAGGARRLYAKTSTGDIEIDVEE